ncbi:protein-glutamate methylesterase/protein-glutamine glutaminase [Aestuariispira insulae]|nr:chemotaxis response regulator protein-glutamate methylesterase [Aestuariispira insulae]
MSNTDQINVMVVDDALVVRGMVTRFLEESDDLSVVVSVGDGERALAALERHDVDVIVLDIEMPRMDGLTALPQLLKKAPGIQIIMASTLTLHNAEISLKALSLGAADYVPKPTTSSEIGGREDFKRELTEKVRTLGRIGRRRRLRRQQMANGTAPAAGTSAAALAAKRSAGQSAGTAAFKAAKPAPQLRSMAAGKVQPDVIAIGSSTGGPQALFQVLKDLGTESQQPIFITQHMPPTFTTILAEHVTKASGRVAKEAVDGEVVQSGRVYIAPGDYHMLVKAEGGQKKIHLTQDPPENFCRPAVDPMLRSIVSAYGGNKVLTIILTGMGADGCAGAKVVVDAGGRVLAQDEETSVVWGMPGAVANAGLCSDILPINDIGSKIKSIALGGSA